MKIHEVMDDLSGRFLMHLPRSELHNTERLFFQVEEAHWFYEDYYRKKYNLPYTNLRDFTLRLIMHSSFAQNVREIDEEFKKFLKYKKTVPVYGALVFNTAMDKILLVKGYGPKSSFTFPRGKVGKSESGRQCAIREVFEEVGYCIENKMIQHIALDMSTKAKESKLFVVMNVTERTKFATQTRNEIREIRWVDISAIERGSNEALSYVRSFITGIKKVVQKIEDKKVCLNRKEINRAFGVE
ncbi:mRNA-decapping enzyme subunit 2 [Nematocida displodere]|uniref:mRNA-decapping enzyme subunit 2 n=1 Tax=Nematocida displodere TaxID=1805483 RepID=A0A177EEM0_9MICR|nr:mRNA-decapping enzyme subunit 2 [Nematocida displodere]